MLFRYLLQRLGQLPTTEEPMPGIDGVRAMAVSFVVLFHIYGFGSDSPQVDVFGIDLRPWFSTGFVGVNLFFVLSGFLLMLPWTRNYFNESPLPKTGEFYRRRVMRIVPAYYFHLVVFFLIMIPYVYSFSVLYSHIGIASILTHFSFTQYLFPWTSAGFGINGALWTLTIEFLFYLILPAVARFFLGWKLFFGLLTALILTQCWLYLSFHELLDFVVRIMPWLNTSNLDENVIQRFFALQFPGQAFFFAIGMAITNLFVLCKKNNHLTGYTGAIFVVFCVIGVLWSMWFICQIDIWNSKWLYGWNIISAGILGLFVMCSAQPNFISIHILGAVPVRIVGVISYGIYLWHLPIIYFFKKIAVSLGFLDVHLFYFMLVTCIPITLIVAYLSFTYVELPFLMRRERKFVRSRI